MPRRLGFLAFGWVLAVAAAPAPATDDAPAPGAATARVLDAGAGAAGPTAAASAVPPDAADGPEPDAAEPADPSPAAAEALPAAAPIPPPVPRAMRDEALAATLAGLVEQAHRLVRAYALLGLQYRPEAGQAALSDAARAGDRQLEVLAAGAARRLGADTMRDLSLRWQALREAAATRPQASIAGPLEAVAGQLAATAARAAARLPVPPRPQRQRILLHRIAAAHALGCWGAVDTPADRMLAMRAEFGHGLADALDDAGLEGGLAGATLRSQWGLLTASLDAGDAGCEPAGVGRIATTTDRLLQHFERGAGTAGDRARR